MDRVSVSEAATRLGVTPDAVRQRIRRGTIEYDKTEDGRYYVYLTAHDSRRDGVQKALIERLHDENEFLRRELERKDALLLNMMEVMKAINPPSAEAPSGRREAPVTASDDVGEGGFSQDEDEAPRPFGWSYLSLHKTKEGATTAATVASVGGGARQGAR